jgi:hypothetical protein
VNVFKLIILQGNNNPMLSGRNIVLKRVGNSLLLPSTEKLEGDAPNNIPGKPFLMCRIVSHDEATGTIELSLLPDNVDERKFQIAIDVNSEDLIAANIKRIIFVGIPNRPIIEPYSFKTDFTPFVNRYTQDEPDGSDDVLAEKIRQRELAQREQAAQKEERKEKQIFAYSIEFPIKDLKFEDELVSFDYYVPQVHSKIHFQITNAFVKKEYDSIKNYFSKALGTKKFTISIHVESFDNKVINHSATSPDVDKIDNSLFELVEDLYIEDSFINNAEDEIYSLEERAKEASKETGSEKIKDAEWLLNKLITKERTKHYYHLRFLSSKHLSEVFHLHLTGKPISFIFLIPNRNDYCLVWETYSTEEATYVWKLNEMSANKLLSSVEELVQNIKWLRKNNKMTFLKNKPTNFKRIEHDYSGEDMGFKKWKAELEKFLLSGNNIPVKL